MDGRAGLAFVGDRFPEDLAVGGVEAEDLEAIDGIRGFGADEGGEHRAGVELAALGFGLLVGLGGGQEDPVAPDDRRGPAGAGDGDLPADVGVGGPFDGEFGLRCQAVAVGAAELRPVGGEKRGGRQGGSAGM